MAKNDSTGATVTMAADTYDAVTLRLEQIVAMIKATGIQVFDTDDIPVSNEVLGIAIQGYATFVADTREMMLDGIRKGGAA